MLSMVQLAMYNNITSIALPTLAFNPTASSAKENDSNVDVSESINENREPFEVAMEQGFGLECQSEVGLSITL